MSVASPHILEWLDLAAEATKDQPVHRRIVIWIASHAVEGRPPKVKSFNIPADQLGCTRGEVVEAITQLRRGHWLSRRRNRGAWRLVLPREARLVARLEGDRKGSTRCRETRWLPRER